MLYHLISNVEMIVKAIVNGKKPATMIVENRYTTLLVSFCSETANSIYTICCQTEQVARAITAWFCSIPCAGLSGDNNAVNDAITNGP